MSLIAAVGSQTPLPKGGRLAFLAAKTYWRMRADNVSNKQIIQGERPRATEGRSSSTALLERLRGNVASVMLGKPDVIRLALVGLLAEGHLLIEDVPGIGKTLLAK